MKKLLLVVILTISVSAYFKPIIICTDDGECSTIYVDDGE